MQQSGRSSFLTRPAWQRYSIAVMLTTLTLVLRYLLEPVLAEQAPLLLFILPVFLSAWYGGLGPGLLATGLSAVVGVYFFVIPVFAYGPLDLANNVRVSIFIIEGTLISTVIGKLQATQQQVTTQQADLQASEDRFRLLIEGVQDYAIFMLDPKGFVASWNAGAEQIKGYRADEIIDQHFSRFYTPEAIAEGLPGHELEIAATMGRYEGEGWRVRKDNTCFWANTVLTALRDDVGQIKGFAKITRDVTARKEAEEQLRISQARLSGIIGSAMDALISIDSQQHIIVFNAAAERMFGYPADQALGQTLDRFLPESVRTAHRQHIPTFGNTGVTNRSMHALRPLSALRANGEEFPIEATISQVDSYGEKLYTVIIRDITERMRAEAERVQLLENERTARAEAEAAVHTRDVFLSIAAHELRTPLTALLGHAHLLERRASRDKSIAERELRGLASISEQAKRLNRLIEALLDVSRIQLGRFQLQQQPFDLSALVSRVIEELQPSLGQHTFDVEYPSALVIVGDEVRLEQVLQNLLGNAIKYSPKGGVIRISVKPQTEMVSICVSDQGMGIPESARPHLFSQFYRATNVDPKRISGLGIGLYVVKEIVTRHGGEITVDSIEGQGATFTVTLPRMEGTIPA